MWLAQKGKMLTLKKLMWWSSFIVYLLTVFYCCAVRWHVQTMKAILTLNTILPLLCIKAHFIKGIVLFLYLNPVNRIYPRKKEKDPYIFWFLKYLVSSEQNCMKILFHHMEKVKFIFKKIKENFHLCNQFFRIC